MKDTVKEDSTWGSSIDQSAAVEWLKSRRRVVVLTHARPDGDALGSTLAITRTLLRLGVEAMPWYVGPMPRWSAELIGETPAEVLDGPAAAALCASIGPGDSNGPDGVVVADTGAWMQVEDLRPFLSGRAGSTLVLDHHLSGNASLADRRIVDPRAASATEVCGPICRALLGGGPLPLDIATPLYTGLATDTGWFRFSNTRPATLRFAAELLEAGVNFSRLFDMIEQQDRPSRLALLGRAMNALEYFDGHRVALMALTRKDFDETHGDAEDTGGFAAHALAVAGLQVAVTLTEAAVREGQGALTKVSLRSKPGPNAVDVAAVCQTLGGGGHARAAGVKLRMSLNEARGRVLAALGVVGAGAP
ncbi:MAG: DHH family phosphoesterase [Phycisphaerales bacterium]